MFDLKNEKELVDLSQTIIYRLEDLQSNNYIPKDINNYLEDLKTLVKIKIENLSIQNKILF